MKIKNVNGKILYFSIVLLCLGLFTLCTQPGQGGDTNDTREMAESVPGKLEFFYYPQDVVIFYESFGLFSTNIVLPEPDLPLGSFSVMLNYDSSIIRFESIYSPGGIVNIVESPGVLRVTGPDLDIEPGQDLFAVTWKALRTGITDISLEAIDLTTTGGQPVILPPEVISTVHILKEQGALHFEGPGYIEKGAEFANTLILDTEEKVITEYDLDISFDPVKIVPNSALGNSGIQPGAGGYINTITAYEDRINISGINETGTGPGTDIEFFLTNWIAVDSGRSLISITINKMITSDNVYLKPDLRGSSITIYSLNNKPVVDVRLEPGDVTVPVETGFMTSLMLNTEGYVLAAYGIDIFYDPEVLGLDVTMAGGTGVEAGDDGFLTAVNILEPGVLRFAGFDLNGVPPNPELELVRIYWKSIGPSESSEIIPDVKDLSDIGSRAIERIRTFNGHITVSG